MEGCQSPRLDWTCEHCDAQRFACVDCGAECIADGSGNELCERCFQPKPKSADRIEELEIVIRAALSYIQNQPSSHGNGHAEMVIAALRGALRNGKSD